jgi:hypothetical protein
VQDNNGENRINGKNNGENRINGKRDESPPKGLPAKS